MCIGVTTVYPGRFAVTNEDDEYYYNFFFRGACKLLPSFRDT